MEGDGMQGPPSPLQFDTALALEDQSIRAIAEAPMDILTEGGGLDATGPELSEGDMDAIIQDQVNALMGTYLSSALSTLSLSLIHTFIYDLGFCKCYLLMSNG